MGQVLNYVSKTSFSVEGDGNSEKNTFNESLLQAILTFCKEDLSLNEINFEFKEELKWNSALTAQNLSSTNLTICSLDVSKDQRPLLRVADNQIYVLNVKSALTVFQASPETEISELKYCLKENEHLLKQILGSTVAEAIIESGSTSRPTLQKLAAEVQEPEDDMRLILGNF